MNIRMIGAAAVVAAVVIAPAQADFVQVRDAVGGEHSNGNPGGPLVVGTGGQLLGTTSNGSDGAVYLGTFDLEADFGGGFMPLITYCMEPNAPLGFDFNPPDSVGLRYQTASLTDAGLTPLYATYLQILWANAFAISTTSPLNAAAFQSIVWEFTEDSVFDLVNGNFRMVPSGDVFTAQVHTLASQWLDNILTGVWTDSTPLLALTHPESQNFIMVVPSPSAAVMMMLFGATAMIGRRRRS